MRKAYLVGSGIASLSTAVYLIRDAKLPGKNIFIFDYENFCGGSLDASGNAKEGYICRGTRGFDYKAYVCMQDLFSSIPSLTTTSISLNEEIHLFTEAFTIHSRTRLMDNGKSIEAQDYGLSAKSLLSMSALLLKSESSISNHPVSDYFPEDFFQSNFWWMFSTIFAFASWHSAAEVRRYMLAFFQNVNDLHTMHSIKACPLNNQESIVRPLVEYLKSQGVQFVLRTEVTDVFFKDSLKGTEVSGLTLRKEEGESQNLVVNNQDMVFLTLGSIAAPTDSWSWLLWKKIASYRKDFGNPDLFLTQPDKTTMTTCTLTLNDLEVYDLLEEKFANIPDTNRLITFKDSPWSMSLVVPKQPWFSNQPQNSRVLWCYGIWPMGVGKYVSKKMREASPDEIVTELYSLLGLPDVPRLVAKTLCRKTVLPTGHAQFVCRKPGDRPKVIVEGAVNFAFLGQYVESEGTTYTMEYSIRTAQKAVYALMDLQLKLPDIYHGYLHPEVQWKVLKTLVG